jgi:hypothetical protein
LEGNINNNIAFLKERRDSKNSIKNSISVLISWKSGTIAFLSFFHSLYNYRNILATVLS